MVIFNRPLRRLVSPSPRHVIDAGEFIEITAQLCPVPLRFSIVSQAIAAHELIYLRSTIQIGAHVDVRRLMMIIIVAQSLLLFVEVFYELYIVIFEP